MDYGLLHSRYSGPTSSPSERRASPEYLDLAWFRFRKWAGMVMPLFSTDGSTWVQFGPGITLENFFATEPDRWGFFIQPVNNATPAIAQRLDVFDWLEATETDLYPHFGSYKNADGQGARTSRITVTMDAAMAGAPIQNLVDGQMLDGLSPWWHSGQSGRHLTFQFAEPKIITDARWFQNAFTPHGTWKWQGSTDGSTWSDLSADFVLDAGPGGGVIGDLSANVEACSHYRIVQTSGVTSDNPFLREIEFKLRRG